VDTVATMMVIAGAVVVTVVVWSTVTMDVVGVTMQEQASEIRDDANPFKTAISGEQREESTRRNCRVRVGSCTSFELCGVASCDKIPSSPTHEFGW
jgi:hypothetical protein